MKPLIKLWGEREEEQNSDGEGTSFITMEKKSRLHPYRVYVDPVFEAESERKRFFFLQAPDFIVLHLPLIFFNRSGKAIKSPFYKINVECGVSEWSVKRKYGDFVVLHHLLQLNYPTVMFPKIPPKFVGGGKDSFKFQFFFIHFF